MKKSLNLAENYVPSWNTWEVAREMICNYMDAGSYEMETPTSDTLILKSASAPSFSELTVIGASTKRHDEKSIGQFGEGFKLATLVTTRMGGSVEVKTPEGRMRFSLEEARGIRDRVLYADLDGRYKASGCTTKVKLSGIASVIEGRFAPRGSVCIAKSAKGPLTIFTKGVFIEKIEGAKSLFDWNVDVTLNRDRAMVSTYDVKNRVSEYFARGLSAYDEIIKVLKDKN